MGRRITLDGTLGIFQGFIEMPIFYGIRVGEKIQCLGMLIVKRENIFHSLTGLFV